MKFFIKLLFITPILTFIIHTSTSQSVSAQVGIAKLYGKIVYNGKPVSTYSEAYASLTSFATINRQPVKVDFQYNNQTGEYYINNVPPGVYKIMFYLDAAPPFGIRSPGDFDNYWSELVDNIEVAPHATSVHIDLQVKHNLRIIRPIDMMDFVRKPRSKKPLVFYEPGYYPSSGVFEWVPVPGASHYEVWFSLMEGNSSNVAGAKRINLISETVNSPRISPGLQLTAAGQWYRLYIKAYNAKKESLGDLTMITSNSYGGGIEFIILPKEKHGGFQTQ